MTGKEIKAIRTGKKWSRERLAVELDVTSTTIYRWETDKTKPHSIFVKALRRLQPR